MRFLLTLLLILALSACATTGGNNFNESSVQDLRPGMTEQEVAQVLGTKATSHQYDVDGSYVAEWHYFSVGTFTSKIELKSASLNFDKNKKFVELVQFEKSISE